jgi:PST family polysaccharide transporter
MQEKQLSEGGTLLGNSVWLILEKVLRLVVGLFVGVQTARFLGPGGMGSWNYYIAIFTFFSVFASLGIDYITPREYAAFPRRKRQIMGVTLVLKIAGATLAVILSCLFLLIIKGFDRSALILLLCLTTGYFFQAFDTIEYYFNSRLKSRYSVLARVIAFLAISAYKLTLVYLGCDLVWFVLSSTLEFMLGSLLLLYFFKIKDELTGNLFYFDKLLAYKLLRDAFPFSLSALMVAVYYRVDQFMITEMIGEASNGVYSVAIRMYELFVIIPTAVVTSFLPVLTTSRSLGKDASRDQQLQLYAILSWMAFAATVFSLVFSPWLMDLLYGDGFKGSGTILQIISLGFYPIFMSMAIGNLLVVNNLGRINMIRNGIGLVMNVGVNFWLIPRYGIAGAAVATVLSQVVALAVALMFRQTSDQPGLLYKAINPMYLVRFSRQHLAGKFWKK